MCTCFCLTAILSPIFLKSRGKNALQPYLAEERQHTIFGRDTSMSSREVSVRIENLPRMDRHDRRRCSQCSHLTAHWYRQSQGTTLPGLSLCVCVCVFLPFRYEFLAFTYFPLSCGAVPPSGARTQHNHLAALVFELLCAHQGDRHAHHVLQP